MKIKPFLTTLFIHQNRWHAHSVLVHTLLVCKYVWRYDRSMLAAGILHDIGKPLTATVDMQYIGDFKFRGHEEASYQIIKNWPFLSQRTKNIVRYHYLLRLANKADGRKSPAIKQFESLDSQLQANLRLFLVCDDKAKD